MQRLNGVDQLVVEAHQVIAGIGSSPMLGPL
jgi:hypothetical protein